MSTDRKMDKQNVEYVYSGVLLSFKKEWNFGTCNNVDEPWKHHATWSKPNTKRQILYESTYDVPRVGKFIETESRTVLARAWGEVGMESYCLMDTEFQFGKMQKFWRWIVVMVSQHSECMNVLNDTEWYI